MKATCPNDPEHKRFTTMAHVSEEWIVDECGNFVEEGDPGCGEVVAGPHPHNTWQCVECGADALVEE